MTLPHRGPDIVYDAAKAQSFLQETIDGTRKKVVRDLVGAAQYYMCCRDLGVPYILTYKAWRVLAPKWMSWLQEHYTGGYQDEQGAFGEAAHAVGVKFNIFKHFMISDPDGQTSEAWPHVNEIIEQRDGDVCNSGIPGERRGLGAMPTFLHLVRPWVVRSRDWGISKYQMPPGWSRATKSDGILECNMAMLAPPPQDLLMKA